MPGAWTGAPGVWTGVPGAWIGAPGGGSGAPGGGSGARPSTAWLPLLLLLVLAACSDPSGPESGNRTLAFSHDAGFYTSPFALSLATPLEDATIYYTLDGSLPDPAAVMDDATWEALPVETRARTFVYDAPVELGPPASRGNEIVGIPTGTMPEPQWAWRPPRQEIQKSVTVRALAVSGSGETGTTATATYFIVPEGRARYSLPVVSITAPRGSLFGADSGIYVPGATGENFAQRGEEWERVAHFELFDRAGRRPVAQDVGVRIHGGWTRALPQKSLRLYSRSDYGTSRFSYRFFDSKAVDDFNRLLLRNAGNDWGYAQFRDGALQTLVQHLPVATQHFQPAILFLNGEYWGIHHIRDRLDQHHIGTHYGVPREDVVILELGGAVSDGEPGDEAPYEELLRQLRAGELRSHEDFDRHIDLPGYLDYNIIQWYAGNDDWPENNIDFWRYKGAGQEPDGPRDGRWRWLLYDVDRSFGIFGSTGIDMVRHVMVNDQSPWARELFRGAMAVEEIRHEFLQRSAVHFATTFRPERVVRHVDSLAALLEPEMGEHALRWSRPESVAAWRDEVEIMRDFASARPAIHRGHLLAHFGEIGGSAELSVANLGSGRAVRLHGVELSAETPGVVLAGGEWVGELFTGIPVVLRSTAVDLSRAVVSEAGSAQVEQSADELRFILTGSARVTLP